MNTNVISVNSNSTISIKNIKLTNNITCTTSQTTPSAIATFNSLTTLNFNNSLSRILQGATGSGFNV